MPVRYVLLPTDGKPLHTLTTSDASPTTWINVVLGGTDQRRVDMVVGSFSCALHFVCSPSGVQSNPNPFATHLIRTFAGGSETVYGKAILTGVGPDNSIVSVGKSNKLVDQQYREFTKKKSEKKVKEGPRTTRNAYMWFCGREHQNLTKEYAEKGEELSRERRTQLLKERWQEAAQNDRKQEFCELEAQDRARYEREKAEWEVGRPPPPAPPQGQSSSIGVCSL